MPEPARTFSRFSGMQGDESVLGDFGTMLNEHSEHIEKVEARLESHGLIMARLLAVIERMHAWQRDVSGELNLALGVDVRPEDDDAD